VGLNHRKDPARDRRYRLSPERIARIRMLRKTGVIDFGDGGPLGRMKADAIARWFGISFSAVYRVWRGEVLVERHAAAFQMRQQPRIP
jgi:hypothetical protein